MTNCAATMPFIVGTSVSRYLVPKSELWMGCVSHQLNTAMKYVMDSPGNDITVSDERNLIIAGHKIMKQVVTSMKQGYRSKKLPPGHALIQEVETRFATTLDVTKRFIYSAHLLKPLLVMLNTNTALRTFQKVLVKFEESKKIVPASKSLVKCLAPIRHV